ncbi:hypothetical protein DR103_03980, partial [Mycoplasma hyorhinis]|nr:hypothetical protein [Mesomycoplasma hyorhinis]
KFSWIILKIIKFIKFFHICKKKKKKDWENFAVKICKDSYNIMTTHTIIYASFICTFILNLNK